MTSTCRKYFWYWHRFAYWDRIDTRYTPLRESHKYWGDRESPHQVTVLCSHAIYLPSRAEMQPEKVIIRIILNTWEAMLAPYHRQIWHPHDSPGVRDSSTTLAWSVPWFHLCLFTFFLVPRLLVSHNFILLRLFILSSSTSSPFLFHFLLALSWLSSCSSCSTPVPFIGLLTCITAHS